MSKRLHRLFYTTAVIVLVGTSARAQNILYVDDDNCPGPGTGTQADPLCRIQRAIELSLAGDEIIVAPGTYHELIDFIGKNVTLRSMKGPDVTIIDAGPVVTTLRGKTVIRFDSGEGPDTVMDGFTITGGTGDITLFGDKTARGGGMFVSFSNPTVTNCIFSANTADHGGGIFANSSTMAMTKCTIVGNSVNAGGNSAGGGMANNKSSPKITNCTFNDNNAQIFGGAMSNNNSNPTVAHSMFTNNNVARFHGGGMYNNNSSNANVINCTFSGNNTNGDFSNGGGMYNDNGSNAKVINCMFSGNNSNGHGGGIFSNDSSLTVINSIFTGNTATNLGVGGGMAVTSGSALVTNCTLSSNTARSGGAIYNGGTLTLTNCILWGNNADNGDQIFRASAIALHIMFSNIEGSGGSDSWDNSLGVNVGGNVDADPLFVDADGEDNIIGTLDDNLRLLPNSPVIDAGINLGPQFDIDGNLRIVDDPTTVDTGVGFPAVIDVGAFEFGSSPIGTGSSDLDADGDTDLTDFAVFMSGFTGVLP